MITKRICFVLLPVLALALVCFIPSCDKPADIGAENFPELSGNRVEMPPQSGEEIRYVYFADDGVTRKLTQIEYRSGLTSFTFYREDGVARETRYYFPLGQGAAKRQLRSLITYEDDGASYRSHQVYREDGSLERNGGRLAQGRYQTLYFSASDGAVQRRLVYSAEHDLEFEERFSGAGRLLEKTEKVSDYELKTTRWSEEGTKLSEINDRKDGTRRGRLFHDDGETARIDFNHRGYRIDVLYFNEDGKLTLEVEYSTEGMATTVFNAGEKAQYKQYWLVVSGRTICDAQFRLVKVEEFHNWGNGRYNYELKRVIGIAGDGKTPNRVIVPARQYGYERTDAELHPDGSVATLKQYDSSNQVVDTRTFAPGVENLDLKPELFVSPTFECLDPPESKLRPDTSEDEMHED